MVVLTTLTAKFFIDNTFTFGVPITVQNNGVLEFDQGAVLNASLANVSLNSGGQVVNNIDFAPLHNVTFGTKGNNQGEFLSYAPITVHDITFTTDKLTLKGNA